jgi:hypothetical protein
MTAGPGTRPSVAPCLRPSSGATVTNLELAPSQGQLCLTLGDHVTVDVTVSSNEIWDPHPQLAGATVQLASAVTGNHTTPPTGHRTQWPSRRCPRN